MKTQSICDLFEEAIHTFLFNIANWNINDITYYSRNNIINNNDGKYNDDDDFVDDMEYDNSKNDDDNKNNDNMSSNNNNNTHSNTCNFTSSDNIYIKIITITAMSIYHQTIHRFTYIAFSF